MLFPPSCASCGVELPSDSGEGLCRQCVGALVNDDRAPCPRCAAPLPRPLREAPHCPHCRTEKFAFASVVALGVYEGPLQDAVLRMKQQPWCVPLAVALGRRLAERVAAQGTSAPDLATPVPTHWLRRLGRGAHAAELLAEVVAGRLGIPFLSHLLAARDLRPRQHTLTPAQRRANMRGAFVVRRGYELGEARVLLVDDALTTGATAHAAAIALQKAGAAEVRVAVVARGIGA